MAYEDRIAAHLTAMIGELPTAAQRIEVAEAIAWDNQWETWRQSQNPPPADNQSNRIAFAKAVWAKQIKTQVISWLATYRRRGDDEATEID